MLRRYNSVVRYLPLPARFPPQLIALIGVMLFGHIAVAGGRVTASLFLLRHGYGEAAVGVLIALYSVLSVAFGMHFGRWSDRYGPQPVIRGGLAAILLGILLPAAWPALPAMMVGGVLCGTGITIVSVAIQHAVGNLPVASPTQRVALFAWLTLGHSTSSVIGPFIAGTVIDTAGFRAAFAVLCGGTLLALLLSTQLRGDAVAADPQAATSTTKAGWRGLLQSPTLRRVYLLTTINAIAWDAFTFFGPVLGHRAALSATAIGTVMSAFALGTLAIRLVVSAAGHRFSEWRMLAAALALEALVWSAFTVARGASALMALAFLLGCGVGCGQPNVLSLLHRHAPQGRAGEAIGLRSLLGNVSGLGVPLLFSATVALAGVWPVCAAIALAAGVASVVGAQTSD
ncbi:hypothetical protein GCM10025771_39410 [Niveibacterium umoris]|uniref:Putative MFS family arabinose efflux permease n=1 Tax=Niveibacterium umoris TaxID=1193620 RepID=A0A840BJX8_9RHOO|nr:putative MFS family arabinose efflux permease [Niveibacterium umoris]